jgi:hypothetical protein
METAMYPPVTQFETRSAERLDQLRLIAERFDSRQAGAPRVRRHSRWDLFRRVSRRLGTFGQNRARPAADRSAAGDRRRIRRASFTRIGP